MFCRNIIPWFLLGSALLFLMTSCSSHAQQRSEASKVDIGQIGGGATERGNGK